MFTRRAWLVSAAGAAAALFSGREVRALLVAEREILIHKSPTCGCCSLWVDHIAEAGFRTTVRDIPNVNPLKVELGVPRELWSCHTALVEGYLVEGHVPADLVLKLLTEKPAAAGLAVAGMPMGSPGMEGPTSQPYDVVLFHHDGSKQVYARR